MVEVSDSGAMDRMYRAAFVSDPHDWSNACRREDFQDFLNWISCDWLYIVGDIVDSWANDFAYWRWKVPRPSVNELITIHGNHDPCGPWFGVAQRDFAVHVTLRRERLLVIHGHQFDTLLHWGPLAWPIAILGDKFNEWLMRKFKLSLAELVAMDQGALARLDSYVYRRVRRMSLDSAVIGHTHIAGGRTWEGMMIRDCGCSLRCPITYWAEDWNGEVNFHRWNRAGTEVPG